jgi:hypothetical protein
MWLGSTNGQYLRRTSADYVNDCGILLIVQSVLLSVRALELDAPRPSEIIEARRLDLPALVSLPPY